MKRIAVAAAVFLFGMGSAWSADILESAAPVSSFNWSGLYVGAQGGYSWVDSSITFPGFPGGFEGNPSPNAFSLGGQAGYRYQFDGGVVVGVEGDIYSYFNKEDAAQLNSGPNGEAITVNYGGSLRGQVGYAFDRFLPYVTGGVAFIDYSGGGIAAFPGPNVAGTDFSETKAGWTVGAGLAYAITDHLIANFDYRYSDYGSTTFATPFAGVGNTKVDLTENAVKFALSYKF